jgi:hypothetical protein
MEPQIKEAEKIQWPQEKVQIDSSCKDSLFLMSLTFIFSKIPMPNHHKQKRRS